MTKRKGFAVLLPDGRLGKVFAIVEDAQFAGEVSDHIGADIVEVAVTYEVVRKVGVVTKTVFPGEGAKTSNRIIIPGLNAPRR
jgi:hypothetical protein